MKRDSSGFFKLDGGVHDVCTDSGLRAWWLSTFKGYRVSSISQMPKMGSFGRMTYYKRWVLSPRKAED